jgi:cyclophilin family peptidyl-prolyl cis-trans isomerase
MLRRTLSLSLLATPLIGINMSDAADLSNEVYMQLKTGRVTIELLPDIAPKMVAHFKQLIADHFYDNTPFHRVIPGFMAQGGDPSGTGMGGSKLGHVKAEFTNERKFLRGTVGAARSQDPNSADSQFFICFAPAPFLDGQYTIFGQVIAGMEYVDEIKKGAGQNGMVSDPDRIVTMRMASDPK